MKASLTVALTGLLALVLVVGCQDKAKDDQIRLHRLNQFLSQPRVEVNGTDYHVLPPDVLEFRSRHVQEIDGIRQSVRPDGRINLPLMGEVQVANKTPHQIEDEIRKAALKYYSVADVMVQVMEYNSQKYYVMGEVVKAGPFPWTGRDTVLDALAKAQPNTLCVPEQVKLLRGMTPQCGGYPFAVDKEGKRAQLQKCQMQCRNDCGSQELTVNVTMMMQQGDMTHNVLLKPNDIIYVPAHPMVTVGYEVIKVLYPLRPVLEGVRTPAAVMAANGN